MTYKLYQGDCLELMKDIPDHSIDMVLCDLPYGTTRNKWDSVIPFDDLWGAYHRLIKKGGAIVLFSQMPFTISLGASNMSELKHEWIWVKNTPTGFLNASRYPLKAHENIMVFCDSLPLYYPQFEETAPRVSQTPSTMSTNYGPHSIGGRGHITTIRYPRDVLEFNVVSSDKHHPTQKPVSLCEYLIRTYTGPGMMVLDNCMGSGTTGVAAIQTGRNFIGIELTEEYYKIAKERISKAEYKHKVRSTLDRFTKAIT